MRRHLHLVRVKLTEDLEDVREVSCTLGQKDLHCDLIIFLEDEIVSLGEQKALLLLIGLQQIDAEEVQLRQRVEVEVLKHDHVDPLPDRPDIRKGPKAIVDAVILQPAI